MKGGLVTLSLHSYNNIRNSKHHFNTDKWLQTTEGAPGTNILKEPGTRKLYFLESNAGQRHSHLVDSSMSHNLKELPKTQIKAYVYELNKRREGKRDQDFSHDPRRGIYKQDP